MGLENVRHRLAADAEVAGVAEVFRCPVHARTAVEAEVAEVAEVFDGRVESVRKSDMQRSQRSCRGFPQTYAPTNGHESSTSQDRAEVAEVSNGLTRAQARARTRARKEKSGREPVQPAQPLRAPGQATILRHCRCVDCLFWRAAPFSECRQGIIRNGISEPQYPPDAWHYCALYHGPQISKDVWVWPKVAPRSRQVGAGSKISDKIEPVAEEGKCPQLA